MRYVGGKSKIAANIAKVILENTSNRSVYYEPFVGGGGMLPYMVPHFSRSEISDISEDLVLMWQGLRQGWKPTIPFVISEEQYVSLKNEKPSALRGLVGFGGSFGGKWFGGYARGRNAHGQPRNHQEESAMNVLSIISQLQHCAVEFYRRSYSDIEPVAGDVVYCDPPYAGTEEYKAVGVFDKDKFWTKMEEWSNKGVKVYVSEYNAPSHWHCIWEKKHQQSLMTAEQGRRFIVEKLFTLNDNKSTNIFEELSS
jgi:DNA adenine methylase